MSIINSNDILSTEVVYKRLYHSYIICLRMNGQNCFGGGRLTLLFIREYEVFKQNSYFRFCRCHIH